MLLTIFLCISISGCMGVYALLTSIYEVPKRHKVDKYYSFSIKITDEGIKKEFNASVLCKHNMGVNAGVGWWDRYETKVQNILIKNDSDSNEWQLTGIYCPNPHVNIMPRGIYKKTKTGQIYYFPLFFGQEKETVSIDWSLELTPKYNVYKNDSSILGETKIYPTGYMYRTMKLLKAPDELKNLKVPTIIGSNTGKCGRNTPRFIYSNQEKSLFDKFNSEYMQRGFLDYDIESDTWTIAKIKEVKQFIDVSSRNSSLGYSDECIKLRIENNTYSIINREYIWFPNENLLIAIRDHHSSSDSVKKNIYIDAIKKCDDIPNDILKEINTYQNFQEVMRNWVTDEEKSKRYPQKKYEILMKVDGVVHCIKWPKSGIDYFIGW